MAEGSDAHVRYLVQSRVVSKSVPNPPWQRSGEVYKTFYEAVAFRDQYAAMISSGGKGDKLAEAMLNLVNEVFKAVDEGAHFQTRIIKRTISDEVIEEIEKVPNAK
jgi:hypothetical protein